MAGIQLGSSFRLSSPVPHLANASFADAPTRLAAGQLRHVSWHYSQESPDAHYRIFPLAACFLADGVTPATQFGTWGTLEAHWRIVPLTSDDLPESATPTNKYYTAARAALKADLVNGVVPAAQLPPATAGNVPATASVAGIVKIGSGVNVAADGTISVVPGTTGTAYTLPQAAAGTLGGLKLGANLTLNATTGQVDAGQAAAYVLPLASPTVRGGVRGAGTGLTGNILVNVDESLSAPVIPYYVGPGQATDGYMTQKAVSDLISNDIGAIIGVTTAGVQLAYATAQQAADAMNAAGGGVVISKIDIAGPIVLQGNTSLYAPGRTIYSHATTAVDTLTLNGCTGSVECRLIERTQAGTGAAVQVTGGNCNIKANVTTTQSLIAITVVSSAILDYRGNLDYTSLESAPAGSTKIGIISYNGSSVSMVGDIVFRANTSDPVALQVADPGGFTAFLYYSGNVRVVNKGRIAFGQSGNLSLRGTFISADQGITSQAGKVDIYASIDTRSAPTPTYLNAPLQVLKNAATPVAAYTMLHTGAELLSPAGIPSIYNSNNAVGIYQVLASGIFVSTTLPDAFTSVSYITSQTLDTISPLVWQAAGNTIDFSLESVRTINATGNLAYLSPSLNIAPLKSKEHYITNGTGTAITLSFPTGWTFFPGPAPTTLAAGKQAILTLRSLGTSDSTIKAAYVAQA